MSDDADRAQERIENTVADGIQAARRARPSLIPAGFCHWCGEVVVHGMLFCDTRDNDCAKDWQHEEDMKRINGHG